MQENCIKKARNCYFSCRKEAAEYNDTLNSRAGAAEKLNVSESSLRDYETGLTPVPVDVVVRMADLYGAPELQAMYCKQDCPIGKYVCRTASVEVKDIKTITSNLLYHIEEVKVMKAIGALLKISRDGKVSDCEKDELECVIQMLEGISGDVSDLRLMLEKRGGESGDDRKDPKDSSGRIWSDIR